MSHSLTAATAAVLGVRWIMQSTHVVQLYSTAMDLRTHKTMSDDNTERPQEHTETDQASEYAKV